MEIEFNTGRISQGGYSQPPARQSATPASPDPVSFSASDSLNSQLSTLSTVRPDQVARAKALVADGNYPSDEVLHRVADRLVNESTSNAGGASE
jgi:anti-sigma28 factor (negative regulator of flagellin synthesis)